MATIHANTQLKTGDTVNGLSGLKDCESGRCLNLRLDGKAVAPEGWSSVCQPPHARYFYVNLNLHEHNPSVPPYKSLRMDVSTKQEAVNLLKQFYAGYSDSNFGCAEEPITKAFVEALERYSVCHTQRQLCTPDRKSKVWCSGGVFARFCPRENAPDVCKDKTTWPKETCSELIYDAASGRFKPACAQHDPYLPESLKNERRCLSLCDAEGNCVIIRRTERGIELWQEKYKQRALIDPATGKVLGMEQDNGTAKLELTSLTDATLPVNRRRTIIGVGETVKVTANQIVEWEIRGGLLHKEHKTATTLIFTADDQEGSIKVIARTDCDEENITFSVIQPKGLMVIRREIIHAQNVLDAGFIANFYLLPNSVNFYRVQVREVDSPAHATGSRINSHGTFHGNYPGGYSPWLDSSYHMKEDGNILSGNDLVYSFLAYFCMRNIQQGEVHYNIPYEWRLKPNGKIYLLTILQQSTITDKNGYTTTRKGLVEITFKFSEPNKNIDIINNQLGGIPRFKSSCP